MDDNTIIINAEFDLEQLKADIEASKDLEDDQSFFEQLALIQKTKTQLGDLNDALKSIEVEAKGLINARAKALYGDDWSAIKGDRFKITRSGSGAVYLINGRPGTKFVKTTQSIITEAVKEHIATTGKLPAGIEPNGERGETIRITVNSDE